MELSRIVISEYSDQQTIYLKEKGGERGFPILIGSAEAFAIDRRLKGIEIPRPMTHDLLSSVIERLGGKLEKIVVNDLRDHTFIATLFIRRGDELIEVDSRPSDAIALGIAFDTPIFVAADVLDQALSPPKVTTAEHIELLRERMNLLGEKIAELADHLANETFLSQTPEELIAEHRRNLKEMQTEHDAIGRVLKKLG